MLPLSQVVQVDTRLEKGYSSHGYWSSLKRIRKLELERGNPFPKLSYPDDTPAIWLCKTKRCAVRYIQTAEESEREPTSEHLRSVAEVVIPKQAVVVASDGEGGLLYLDLSRVNVRKTGQTKKTVRLVTMAYRRKWRWTDKHGNVFYGRKSKWPTHVHTVVTGSASHIVGASGSNVVPDGGAVPVSDLLSVDISLPIPLKSNYYRLLRAISESGIDNETYDISDLVGDEDSVSIDGQSSSILKILKIAETMFPGIEVKWIELDKEGAILGGAVPLEKTKVYRGLNFERETTDWMLSPTEMAEKISDRTINIEKPGVAWTSDFDTAEMFASSKRDPAEGEMYRPYDSAKGVIIEGVVSEEDIETRFPTVEEGGESEVRVVTPTSVVITKIHIPTIKRINKRGEVKGGNWISLPPTPENLKRVQEFIDKPLTLPVVGRPPAPSPRSMGIKKYLEAVKRGEIEGIGSAARFEPKGR